MDFKISGSFLSIDGQAKLKNLEACQQKLCFTATDFEFLKSLLKDLAQHEAAILLKCLRKTEKACI